MSELQVLLDGRGARPEELAIAAVTLLATVPRASAPHVGLLGTGAVRALQHRLGERLRELDPATAPLRRHVPLIVVPGRAAIACGAVRRLLADLATPGRCLTCVLVPGGDGTDRLACWAPRWLGDWAGSLPDLLDADLAFDREHLPAGSPVARAWLRPDAVGVASATAVGADPEGWARRTGLLLDRDAAVASVRAPLGAVRRRVSRARQRRSRAQVLR